jgi:superfamily I DNA and/or RNA helicase
VTPTSSSKAKAKIRLWKQNFLDLSNRNPQLNFSTKRYVVEVISPSCSTIFRILVIMGQTCQFPPVYKPPSRKRKKSKPDQQKTPFKANPEPELSDSLKETHRIALEKIKDKARLTEFITELTDSTLRTRIKKYLQKAKEMEEERGVNVLYITFGLLNWIEVGDNTPMKSPLLFVPVKISLKPLEIEILDDEVMVNPALKEKLKGENIKLPPFPEEFDSISFDRYLNEVSELIERESGWTLEKRSFIGTFAFTKAALFEDLDDHEDLILRHPIVRAIAEEKGFAEEKENLPKIEELGDNLDTINSYSILDCDSSQMEAVIYAKSGSSLVIQGPPGTGKSQCISNIIAECLAVGKKVLFVAQKRAALDVVKKRLDTCGIGPFCLQVHSQNANKIAILKQIEQSMNLDTEGIKIKKGKFQELGILKERLNDYITSTQSPYGLMKLSFYDIIGRVLALDDIPLIISEFKDPKNVSEEEFIEIKDLFGQLELFRDTLEHYDQNPWSLAKAKIKFLLQIAKELQLALNKILYSFQYVNGQIGSELKILNDKFPNGVEEIGEVPENRTQWEKYIIKAKYWISALESFNLWQTWEIDYSDLNQYFELDSIINFNEFSEIFKSFEQINLAYETESSPSLSITSLLITKLNQYIEKINKLNNRIIVFNLKSGLKPILNDEDFQEYFDFFSIFNENALTLDVDLLLARFTTDYAGVLKKHGPEYNADKLQILNCVRKIAKKQSVLGYLNKIKNFKVFAGNPDGLSLDTIKIIIEDFHLLSDEWKETHPLENFLKPVLVIEPLPLNPKQDLWEKYENFAKRWLKDLPHLNEWFEIIKIENNLEKHGFSSILEKIKNQRFEIKDNSNLEIIEIPLEKLFEKAFYNKLYEDIISTLPIINNFDIKYHMKTIEKFRKIDKEILVINRLRVIKKLYDLRPKIDLNISDSLLAQSGFIKRELKKKRNVKPLRYSFKEAKEFISQLKPCFMMSPLAIANFLPIEEYNNFFDVVIFDEASQVTPEDAIGAILRGKSLIVVGDSQQLPPTNFFTASSINSSDFDDLDDLDSNLQTMESLLDECTGIGFREKMLKFHYRSRKEGLIAFSNQQYYNGRLFTFPDISNEDQGDQKISIETQTSDEEKLENYSNIDDLTAICFRYIKDGVKVKAKNVIEADFVAQAIINHYKSNQKYGTNYSLGIVAFSVAQQETIRSALEKLIRKEPSIESIMNKDEEEGLFIKNLESVQGDERDFIFFSVGYAKDPKGKLSLNFGPLNRSGGYRRLNVAITRARFHIKIFASFLPSEINLERVKARGLRDLIGYMRYARSNKLAKVKTVSKKKTFEFDSFESSVKSSLEKEGFTVKTLIGHSNFRIDLAIIDPKKPSRFILGLECDGGSYKAAQNTRDRDRIRSEVLDGLGWEIYHIWAPDWYNNREQIIKKIKRKVNQRMKEIEA